MKRLAKNSRYGIATALAALTTCAIALPVLHAQPAMQGDDETIPTEAAPVAPPAAPPAGAGAPQAAPVDPRRFDWRKATPEQRQQMMQQMQATQVQQREDGLRRTMTDLKFTDKATQDAILAHLKQREEASTALQAKARSLGTALRNDALPAAQLLTLLTDYQSSVEADRANRREAEAALDTQIKYSQDPRLQTFLVLLGGVGDGPSLMQDAGGRGGRGNGRGRGKRGNAPQDAAPQDPA